MLFRSGIYDAARLSGGLLAMPAVGFSGLGALAVGRDPERVMQQTSNFLIPPRSYAPSVVDSAMQSLQQYRMKLGGAVQDKLGNSPVATGVATAASLLPDVALLALGKASLPVASELDIPAIASKTADWFKVTKDNLKQAGFFHDPAMLDVQNRLSMIDEAIQNGTKTLTEAQRAITQKHPDDLTYEHAKNHLDRSQKALESMQTERGDLLKQMKANERGSFSIKPVDLKSQIASIEQKIGNSIKELQRAKLNMTSTPEDSPLQVHIKQVHQDRMTSVDKLILERERLIKELFKAENSLRIVSKETK